MRFVLIGLVIVLAGANVWLLVDRSEAPKPEPGNAPRDAVQAPHASDYVGAEACRGPRVCPTSRSRRPRRSLPSAA